MMTFEDLTKTIQDMVNQFKVGYKTSEFWLLFLSLVVNGVIAAWDPSQSWQDQVAALALAGAAAAYAGFRSHLKTKRVAGLAQILSIVSAGVGAVGSAVVDTGDGEGDPTTPPDTGA